MHDRPVHRFRIDVLGSEAGAAGAALEALGALPFGPSDPGCWAWSTDGGWEAIAEFSRTQPSAPLSVQGFQEYRDEIAWASVTDGEVAVVSRRSVLPSDWGSFHDEDGKPLDREVLAWAGSVIAGSGDEFESSTLFCGLETALVVGAELGRFVSAARDFLADGAPTPRTLEAISRLARIGLQVSLASQPRSKGELSYLLPLRLTQSVVHAGRDEYSDQPGQADWQWWLGILLSSAAGIIDDAHMCDVVPTPSEPPEAETRHPGEWMELAAGALVTSCVQALALFGSSAAGTDTTPRYRSPLR